ncbi:hypothetical protein PENSUB_5671 [Penicillium subrubescens]|uniref:Transcription factor domain-containing protein n=2 Tax=Penicillium subrubescens TaxID=1316194 RepID=A0A1Q5U754_9EURO|nr:hypothetical protein PENSUB_5671 [Penicillium subrubescens]
MTADCLEKILMGHRVPSAVPAALREELSGYERIPSSRQHADAASGSFHSLLRTSGSVSLAHPATICLASYLPSEADALRLFDYYKNHLDYQYHLVVPARTKRDIHALYEAIARGESGDLNQIALLFSIIATALFYQLLSTDSPDVAEICSRETVFLAGAALIQSNYVAYPTVEGLQAAMIIGHHLSSLTLNPSVSSLFSQGGLVSQAKSLGLHLLDCPQVVAARQEKGFDKSEIELKRRLWWDLASYDWLVGFLSGPQEWTYTIQPQHMNVRRPLNIEDDSIGNETELPLSTPTCMSYSLHRLRLAEVCREIVDAGAPHHLQGEEITYEIILDLDRKLQQAYSELPTFFRFDTSSRRQFANIYRGRPEIAWQRALIQQAYHSRLCRLHRQYFIRGAKDPKYSYSHVVSLQSARKVLEIKRIMDEEEPLFTPNSSFFWAVMHHVFMAAVILLIDVCFNWDDILACKRKEEVLDACRLLSRAQQSSAVARKCINAMMDILRRHWKQEKRPVSSGEMQAQLTSSPGLPFSVLHDQCAIPAAKNVQDSKGFHFAGPEQVHNLAIHDQPIEFVSSELGFAPLEDLWGQMLDESAHIALDTPEWMDLLTELTNATAPDRVNDPGAIE